MSPARPTTVSPALVLAGLATLAVSLGCLHEARTLAREKGSRPFSLLETLLGESRRLFANHFFVKADAYFHSGYYPTIFDNRESFQTAHIAADAGVAEEKNTGDEHSFLGKPLDPLEAFSRRFFPSVHTHLDEGGAADHHHDHDHGDHDHHHDHGHEHGGDGDVREILPWLSIAAALDPQHIETYTVTAYWLRERLHRSEEAEKVLREGLRQNPGNAALLFELGRIFQQDRKDVERARNVFEAGIRSWNSQEASNPDPNRFLALQLLSHLAQLEDEAGNTERAIQLWEAAKPFSPQPEGPQKHIDELRAKLAQPAP